LPVRFVNRICDQVLFGVAAPPLACCLAWAVSASDAQLATLATACTQRLTQRAQHREKQAAKPGLPAAQPAPSLPPGTLMMTFK